MRKTCTVAFFVALVITGNALADDWPMLGRDKTRNAVSLEKNPPLWWQVPITEGPARNAGSNIKWQAKLPDSSLSQGAPVVANGMVWVGFRVRGKKKDASVLACFREADGKLLYQYRTPDRNNSGFDGPEAGHTSSPLLEGDRLWFTTPIGEIVCLDVAPLRRGDGDPKVVWKIDMVKEFDIFPSQAPMSFGRTCSMAASYKDRIHVCTGNGQTWDGETPKPKAPSLVCLDKNTGKVHWTDNSPGKDILEGQWASPLVMEINGRGQVIAPQGDGWLRSFDALTGELIWKFNTNPSTIKKPEQRGHLLAAPVYHDGYLYIGNGVFEPYSQPEQTYFYCIDPNKKGDISPEIKNAQGRFEKNPNSGEIWKHGGRQGKRRVFLGTTGNAVVNKGLVIVAENNGYLNCLDAKTGTPYWRYDLKADINGDPICIDSYVYITTSDSTSHVVELSKDLAVRGLVEMDDSIRASPAFANGVLFLATRGELLAVAGKEKPPVNPPKGFRPALDAHFVPTPQDIVEKMLELGRVKKSDVVYDLGCGDGRIVVTAAKKFGCKAVGVDLDPDCIALSRDRVKKNGVSELVTIEQKDLFSVDLKSADVVALYLLPKLNVKLLPQFEKLKPGARIVSHAFAIEGYESDQVVRQTSEQDGVVHTLYLWKTPLKKSKVK